MIAILEWACELFSYDVNDVLKPIFIIIWLHLKKNRFLLDDVAEWDPNGSVLVR